MFVPPLLISSEFFLVCKNPGISGTLALFCLFLFLFVWIYWTPELLTWGWCSRLGTAHAQVLHDLSTQLGHLQLYFSDFLNSLLVYWGFAILTCRCFTPSVCPTPKSWIYVTTLYFPENTFNIPRFIWLRSKQLLQASWLHLHRAYEYRCKWGLVREKLWHLSRILTLVSGLPKVIFLKIQLLFCLFFFLEFLNLPRISESPEISSSQCNRSLFQLHSGAKELTVTLLMSFLFTDFWTFYPFSSLTLMRLSLQQHVTAALMTLILFWWNACVIGSFFFMSAMKAKGTECCRYSRPPLSYKAVVLGDKTT